MPWDDGSNSVENAVTRVDVFFEFLEKIASTFTAGTTATSPRNWRSCRLQRRLTPSSPSLRPNKRKPASSSLGHSLLFPIHAIRKEAPRRQMPTYLLACTAQSKKLLNASKELDGLGYTWGGREGYSTLLNTNMKRARPPAFSHMAIAHADKIGFHGPFYIEPKPREPSTHQHDSDSAACLNFLREYGLMDRFKLNIETNHATLAGHTMQHELTVCNNANMLGSVDANRGDELIGWDTDQFPTDLSDHTGHAMRARNGWLHDWRPQLRRQAPP